MEKERQLKRCLQKVDRLCQNVGAMTWIERCLDVALALQGQRPPFTVRQDQLLKAIAEWPENGGLARG